MNSDRFIDKSHMPTEDEVYSSLGTEAKDAWAGLMSFAAQNYDHTAEWNYGGKNYGWNVRYRKSGKTLFCMFPEKKGFTVLLVLGKKEIEVYRDRCAEFGGSFRSMFDTAAQFHDGKWLWIRVENAIQLEDIQRMILIKRKAKIRQ
ncbi:DUF3788 family protein [Paenibacillus sp. LMG 31459]|uniref:DUF3788 family protein n=1 Tax=Paenibacillus phytohabitans TaxID=2654978 RepID=A0ABX1YGE8_9BACL|nr:DUF3788 domain-containing protein [Paenibacillus phytohabitans]NOU80080.1 DUF3788 family protein [Paenibacillus phytohabitans]